MTRFQNLGAALFQGAPERTALIDLGGEAPRQFSFAEIEAMCGRTAQALLACGLVVGDRVAVLAANRAEVLFVLLGAMRAGLVAVPINHKLPAAMVAEILADCGARLVFVDAPCRPLVPNGVQSIALETFDRFLGRAEALPAVAPSPSDPAMILYTSGSTGRPKGVVLSHRSHLWVIAVRSRRAGLDAERVLVAAPLYHMNGLGMSQLTLATGGVLILLPGFSVGPYVAAAAEYRATTLASMPPMMAMVLQAPELLADADLSGIRSIRMGSAPVTQTLLDRVRRAFPHAEIAVAYGTTEAGPVVFAPHPDGVPTPSGSLGWAHPEVSLRLVRDGVAVADQGVLQVRCPAVMTGYHNLPHATAAALTPDGYSITGDVFARDAAGFFRFVGRADDMFVSGGENIYPGAVEAMLERHPAIAQACVVPVPDAIKGAKPTAFVVLTPGARLTEEEVRRHALDHAPAYAHPRRVWFLPELPLAGTSKVDRGALLARALHMPW